MTAALLSLNTNTGEMNVYVRSLRGGLKRNANFRMSAADWASVREDPTLPESIELERRKNSQSDYVPVNPSGGNTPGAPMAMRVAV